MQSSINDGFFPRCSRLFATYPVVMLIAFLRNVIAMMTGTAPFLVPPPNPTLAVLGTAVDDLEAKNQASMSGGRVDVAVRRAAQAVVLTLARQIANYVDTQANGALDVLLSSGFEPVRAPSPSVVPATPWKPTLRRSGVSGELMFRFNGDPNARNYMVQYAESVAGPWTDNGLSTSTRVKIEGLTPAKTYWVQACSNGTAGTSNWSDPISLIVV